ncbi:hypothetical protein TNCV_1315301 [Trichonephila clavipes]|uniref:Uncharacterized protein n=1 Tax=Trichonephila clavipes TaxID=2585209 RepID=A0A8X6SLR2_TRICX|nr:hypothetical protein TNCV_1315301 [Trichonephila clavipes]
MSRQSDLPVSMAWFFLSGGWNLDKHKELELQEVSLQDCEIDSKKQTMFDVEQVVYGFLLQIMTNLFCKQKVETENQCVTDSKTIFSNRRKSLKPNNSKWESCRMVGMHVGQWHVFVDIKTQRDNLRKRYSR